MNVVQSSLICALVSRIYSGAKHGLRDLRQGMRESVCGSALSRFGAAFERSVCGSLLYALLTGQKDSPPPSHRFTAGPRRLWAALLHALRLDRLLQGSIFVHPFFWCALAAVAAPLVPTIGILALVFAGTVSLALTMGIRSELHLRRTPLNKWVLLYALVFAYSTVTSYSVSGSLFAGLLTVLFTLFYLVLVTAVQGWQQLTRLLNGMIGAGVLVALYGLWQYLHPEQYNSTWLDTDMFSSITLRVYSTLANPNVLGTYFLLVIPLCAAMLLIAPNRLRKTVYAVCFLIMCLCLLLTYSRGCYLGLLFAIAVFLVLLDRRFLLLGIVLLVFSPLYLPDTILTRFTSIGNMSDSSTSYRVYIWLGTLDMLKKFWFTGIGPGETAFNTVYPLYSYSAIVAPHAHNLFLQIVCNTGIVGLLTFLGGILCFIRRCCTALRRETDQDGRILQITALSAVMGFLVESMTDYTFYNYRVMFLFWVFLALSMLFTRTRELKLHDLPGEASPWRPVPADGTRPLRVLNICSDTNIGGAGRCLTNYLRFSDREHFDTAFLLPEGSLLTEELRRLGATVMEAPIEGNRSLDLRAIPVLRRIVAAAGPDIIHTHGSMSGRIAARSCRAKLVYSRHSAFPVPENMKHGPRHWFNGLLNILYADRIVAVSPATQENLLESGVPADRIQVVMNGVNPLVRPPAQVTQEWKTRLKLEEGDFVVGILARLEEYKGHLILLDAAAQLRREGYPLKVLIAGKGDFAEAIDRRILELNLSDSVTDLGFTTQVPEFLSVLDVQLNCSYGTEATSLSLLEGFSIGLPAVVSTFGGNPWLVEDGVNGYLFENRSAESLAQKLRTLMDHPELLPAMREHARVIFEQRFTGQIYARNLETFYLETTNVRCK